MATKVMCFARSCRKVTELSGTLFEADAKPWKCVHCGAVNSTAAGIGRLAQKEGGARGAVKARNRVRNAHTKAEEAQRRQR